MEVFNMPAKIKNAIVGYDLSKNPDVSNIPAKSFLLINEQNIIQDIIEKQIVSKYSISLKGLLEGRNTLNITLM